MTALQSGRFGAIDWGAVQAGVTVMMIPCLDPLPASAALLHPRPDGRRREMTHPPRNGPAHGRFATDRISPDLPAPSVRCRVPNVDVGGLLGRPRRCRCCPHGRYPLRALRRGRHARPDRSGPAESPGVRMPFHMQRRWHARTVTTQMFWDSDLGKIDRDRRLFALPQARIRSSRRKIDAIIDMYAKLQQPDGYLSTPGSSASSPASAGPICATATSSIAPAT